MRMCATCSTMCAVQLVQLTVAATCIFRLFCGPKTGSELSLGLCVPHAFLQRWPGAQEGLGQLPQCAHDAASLEERPAAALHHKPFLWVCKHTFQHRSSYGLKRAHVAPLSNIGYTHTSLQGNHCTVLGTLLRLSA
jgi:hypothetical protein